jgi:integrase
MLKFAVKSEMIDSNPATDVEKFKSGKGFHNWTEEEIARFEAVYAVGTKARLAEALLLYTGQRVSDVCRMGWQHVTGDTIKFTQQKTGKPLDLQLHPALLAMLAALPRKNLTFVMTERGSSFDAHGFSNWFKKQCRLAGLPHCSAHGLRHAAITRLVNAGCSNEQMKAFSGHRSDSALAAYKRAGDQRLLARQALSMQIGAEGERDLYQPSRSQIIPAGKK